MERPQPQPASPAVSDAYMITMLPGISFCRWGVGKESAPYPKKLAIILGVFYNMLDTGKWG